MTFQQLSIWEASLLAFRESGASVCARHAWEGDGKSGKVCLPVGGFRDWEEYYMARQLVARKERLEKLGVKVFFTAEEVDRLWNK